MDHRVQGQGKAPFQGRTACGEGSSGATPGGAEPGVWCRRERWRLDPGGTIGHSTGLLLTCASSPAAASAPGCAAPGCPGCLLLVPPYVHVIPQQ